MLQMTRCFLVDMIKNQHGHIVSISSMAGLYSNPHSVVYSASKYAVTGFMIALTENLRYEKMHDKIITTTIYPYYVRTRQDIVDHLNPKQVQNNSWKCLTQFNTFLFLV